jgi:hypothetical protein
LCYEHSPAEGIGILNIVDDFMSKLKTSEKDGLVSKCADNGGIPEAARDASTKSPSDVPIPLKLEWTIAPDTKNAVREACVEIDRFAIKCPSWHNLL